MKYTQEEARYFYWHCRAAALLLDQLEEENAATSSNVRHAIRKATETAVGKDGVQYASEEALRLKNSIGKGWSRRGFTKEHAIPVSVITKEIREKHASDVGYVWRELLHDLHPADHQNWGVVDSDDFLSERAPFSAVIAVIVRRRARLAWITKAEDKALKENGLTKVMPPGFDGDDLARYKFCNIRMQAL
jgi:hypothetical protein